MFGGSVARRQPDGRWHSAMALTAAKVPLLVDIRSCLRSIALGFDGGFELGKIWSGCEKIIVWSSV
jgi:hypothetical protein